MNQYLITSSADLDCVWCDTADTGTGEHDALVWGKNGFKTHGRAGLTLRDGGDDPEAIGLDGVVRDPGHVTEVDAATLDRPEPVRLGCAGDCQGERGGDDGAIDGHCDLLGGRCRTRRPL